MVLNREWHMKTRMPKNATLEEKVAWHREHQKNCSCRPFPEKLAEKMREKKQGRCG